MKEVFIIADNIISPLGFSTAENFQQLKQSVSGIQVHEDKKIADEPFYASLFPACCEVFRGDRYTRFEQLLIASIEATLASTNLDVTNKNTILIISSTKGNINLIETEENNEALKKRVALHTSAQLVADHFHFANKPLVVSNACISGLLAIVTGMRLIQSGVYENAVVAGADVITKFVMSGFQSFQAVSAEPCKPFDADRTGINLGEGAATMILSSNKKNTNGIKVTGGVTGNDANHISGPSRTGMELSYVLQKAVKEAGLGNADVDFISAHGTATMYNDEMESKAITIAGMERTPVNSLKGYYGHTLGAAGLIESIITIQQMKENLVIPTKGFQHLGVTKPVNIAANTIIEKNLTHCLKIASGFGGCNGAVVFSKTE